MPCALKPRRRSKRYRLTPERLLCAQQVVLLHALWGERDRLARQYEPLVNHLWGKLKHVPSMQQLGLEDAMQIGRQWLLYLALHYDPSSGYKFMTYAYRSIRGQLVTESVKAAAAVHVPQHLIFKAAADPDAPGGNAFRCPTLSDMVRNKDHGFDRAAPEPEPSSADEEAVARALLQLPPREGEVVRLYYWQGLTYEQIGQKLGVTRERVRQLLIRAWGILRPLLAGYRDHAG